MGAKAGLGLKFLQWFIRAIQFLGAAVILGIYSYFLATLHNHSLHIGNSLRATEGISGAAVLYTLIGLLLLFCVAGHTFTSLFAIVLDVAFIGAFIYVATVNRHGAGSCSGYLDTPFGKGNAGDEAQGSDGFTNLPSFHTACRLQTACLAISIILIFFFIFSLLMEIALVRHHRKEKRFGPSPGNNYTSGYSKRGGFMSRVFRRKSTRTAEDTNALPEHTHPDQLAGDRQSYGTETTAVNDNRYSADHHKYEAGYGYQPQELGTNTAHNGGTIPYTTNAAPQPPRNYRYEDGVYDHA